MVLTECGQHEEAAELFATAEGWPLTPVVSKAVDRARKRVAEALPAERLEAATERGRGLDLSSAKALARELLRDQEAARASRPAGAS